LPTSELSPDSIDKRTTALLFAALFAILLASRLCHTDILWADEDYHQAAAMQILHGKVLYRDLWYDKPPLNVAVYALFGAAGGVVLRVASAVYAWLVCAAASHFASRLWSRREGLIAASLAAFFLIFYFPAATITLEPDTLMILPHLWAVYLAWQRRPFAAGIVAGLAMLLNVKGIFVLAEAFALCAFSWTALGWLAVGFLIPNAAGLVWLQTQGALAGYIEQVWRWGLLYTGSPASFATGVARLGNWTAFHAALVIAAVWCWWEDSEWRPRWIGWTVISLAGAAVGWRFLPRYMDQLLPPLIIPASHGFALVAASRGFALDAAFREFTQARGTKLRALEAALAVTLLIPVIRFGPRYAILAAETTRGAPHTWTDTAMDRDSHAAAGVILKISSPHSTLFVWGYRPNIFVYTHLAAASRFWDSQPLTGVPADRHLGDDQAIFGNSAARWLAENRAELTRSHPDFIADGLSLYNPRLDIHRYPDLAPWLAGYCEAERTTGTIIYRRCEPR
jgi:hypothetical protein